VFLGTARNEGREYYVRQFHDMKGTPDIAGMSPSAFGEYVSVCAPSLARAHAQSVNASMFSRIRRKETPRCARQSSTGPTPTPITPSTTPISYEPRPKPGRST
jgi:hypothetical protein